MSDRSAFKSTGKKGDAEEVVGPIRDEVIFAFLFSIQVFTF